MDQNGPNRTETEALAAHSAAAVRSLRSRAQRVLDERQQRLADIEQRIAAQLELVSVELTRDEVSRPSNDPTAELDALNELRCEFDRQRAEWELLHNQQVEELETARQQVEQVSHELSVKTAEVDARAVELETRSSELDALSVELTDLKSKLAAERELAKEQFEALDRERAELKAAEAQVRSEQTAKEQADRNEQNRFEGERERWQSERQQFDTVVREKESQCEELRSELEDARHRIANLQQSGKSDLDGARNELTAQAANWQRERAKLATARSELADELQSVRAQLSRSLEQEATASAGLLEVVPKFELAMEDVRRLRGRIGELEQELASRPQRDQSENPHLVQLQAERDALAEQVAELEARLATGSKSTDENEFADLQRRFEMAVEDVRQLKTEKAKLEGALEAAKQSPGAATDGAPTDWEGQKRRLLASLEGDDPTTPERRQERTSIEGTIRITDEVVAAKDREIETLRQELDAASASAPDRIVDADELIRAERERLAALESELHERQRTAEMELSTARAKLTRQESELDNLRSELESLRKAGGAPPAGPTAAKGPQKRKWFDKLGLGSDGEG